MAKITMKKTLTLEECFEKFINSKTAEGLSKKTISGYIGHFKTISRYVNIQTPIAEFQKEEAEEMVKRMQATELATNSIASYIRTFKTFISWCNEEGLTTVKIPKYKTEETIQDIYNDEELLALLKKPNLNKCDFTEYRNWVIVNFLISTGCRASTLRAIRRKDINFENHFVYYRHTKNGKVQVMPLCAQMINILSEYLYYRNCNEDDFLFCTEYGEPLTENALKIAIRTYNQSRSVNKTSTHLFRHTFARKFLTDCGGDPFTLQRLLGHSTLEMTKHYCRISNKDIANSFDILSPLEQIKPTSQRLRIK